ncbi:succinate dehydrogenase, cytochrome b556 subunit [Helicocarpus griseus UAMH5409]|uniref:Succinate dehydrogenase, cytochrome b556 subunit n=1 Tax=Helicocarpus griseus UAMH5409 TaxID=1447875 RepID=A0A2B7X8X8_9EURO|nr:succinate dehydrogenase, cytochrome b556 subunit [Helicocarpus griseus UAMH5409]
MASRTLARQPLRQCAIGQPCISSRGPINAIPPLVIGTKGCIQTRFMILPNFCLDNYKPKSTRVRLLPQLTSQMGRASSSSKPSNPNDLVKQRLNRPVSPNLSIYRPQITSVLSILHRNTGLVLSGGLYIFLAAYAAAPLVGWHLDSASLAVSFGALPAAAKVLLKTVIAFPFTFHGFNGVRHLVWDTARTLSNKQVIKTGWLVVGLSVSSAVLLGFL